MRRTEFMTEKRDFDKLTADVLMEHNVVSCKPADTARHVASQMTKHNFGSIPVVDDGGKLLGLVTEFDLLRVLLEDKDLEKIKSEEIMTRELKTVEVNTPVDEVIRLLEHHHLIRVPVVQDGKIKGILARRDVLLGYIKSTAKYWP